MHRHLFLDIKCSKKETIFQEHTLRKLFADKYLWANVYTFFKQNGYCLFTCMMFGFEIIILKGP